MFQSAYAVSAMEEETTKSLRISFHLYTATTARVIDFNLNFLMQPTDLMMSLAIGNLG